MTNRVPEDEGLEPPRRLQVLRELLVGADMAGLPLELARAVARTKMPENGRSVIVLPGYGANDLSTAPLRYYLNRLGHQAEGWRQGTNTGGRGLIVSLDELSDRWQFDRDKATVDEAAVPALCERMVAHTRSRAHQIGRPVTLIGWSLGGYVAREVARDLPDEVEAVITMGSPVRGGPKYTRLAELYRARGFDLDRMEKEIAARSERPIEQPITAIFSKQDGIVGWRAAIDSISPRVRHIEVQASHLGLGVNARVWSIIAETLTLA